MPIYSKTISYNKVMVDNLHAIKHIFSTLEKVVSRAEFKGKSYKFLIRQMNCKMFFSIEIVSTYCQ